jgi:predicted permease
MDQYATVVNTLGKVVSRCLQPPVIGALLGLFVASMPALRGILVDTVTRANQAPLQWFYDGLYSLGQAAVPINMVILGSSLIPSNKKDVDDDMAIQMLPKRSMIGIVIGKMVVLPIIGVISCCILKRYIWSIPEGKKDPHSCLYLHDKMHVS